MSWNNHDEAGVKLLHDAGSDWAFYNGGNRWTYGCYMYKAAREFGMKFRVSWHWNAVAGDPYYALDCREDDFAWCNASPDGRLIPSVEFERLREGLDDYRRLITLDRLAREKSDRPAAQAGPLADRRPDEGLPPRPARARRPVPTGRLVPVPQPGGRCDRGAAKVEEGGRSIPSPAGRRCRAAADEGLGTVQPPTLTRPPATLSRRERVEPSPAGRRCRAAADEGQRHGAGRPVPHPQPPRMKRLCSLPDPFEPEANEEAAGDQLDLDAPDLVLLAVEHLSIRVDHHRLLRLDQQMAATMKMQLGMLPRRALGLSLGMSRIASQRESFPA